MVAFDFLPENFGRWQEPKNAILSMTAGYRWEISLVVTGGRDEKTSHSHHSHYYFYLT